MFISRSIPNLAVLLFTIFSIFVDSHAESPVVSVSKIPIKNTYWNWLVVDEAGKPLENAIVFEPRLWFGSYQHTKSSVIAVENAFHISSDIAPVCSALEKWILENPEPFELPELERMYDAILPMSLEYRGATDKNGLKDEASGDYSQPKSALRIIFKPGYYPVVFQYELSNSLSIESRPSVTITLRQWPERMQTLASRPWVSKNISLQLKNIEERSKAYRAKGGFSFSNYPSLKLAGELNKLTAEANKGNFPKDAAWLTIATAYAPKKLPHVTDKTGEVHDIVNGRIYKALDNAVRISPDITILNGQKSIRDFILRFPNGISGLKGMITLNPDIPENYFNTNAPWTREVFDDYLATIKPYEPDAFTAIAITSKLAGSGLTVNSSPDIREDFFKHRRGLRKKLIEAYPTASWHSQGIDRWDMIYEAEFHQPYYTNSF